MLHASLSRVRSHHLRSAGVLVEFDSLSADMPGSVSAKFLSSPGFVTMVFHWFLQNRTLVPWFYLVLLPMPSFV